MTMRDLFYDVVADILSSDERAVLVLADIGTGRLAHGDRIVNVGIREQLTIGVAAGLALEGFRPLVHSYAPFLVQRPFEQIKLDLGHQGVGAILVSVGASYGASTEGRTHQAPEDVALLSSLPEWTIHVPGHPDEMERQLRQATNSHGCVYIRLDEMSNARQHSSSDQITPITQGSAGAPTVLAVGPMLDSVAAALRHEDVTIAYTSTVRPFDDAGLQTLVGDAPEVVVVEPYLEGTSSHTVTSALSSRPRRVLSLGYRLRESRGYGSPEDHLRDHGLDQGSLHERIGAFLAGAPAV